MISSQITIPQKYRPFFLHFSVWATLLFILTTHVYLEHDKFPIDAYSKVIIGLFVFYINYLVLVPKLFFKRKVFLYVTAALILCTIGANIIYQLEISHILNTFYDDDHKHHKSRTIAFMVYSSSVTIGAIIRTYKKWSENELARTEIENQKNISELEALKNQINPHFLFNSLNSICSLAVKKSDDAPEAIIMLSELMRYMLYETKSKFVPLTKEIEHINNYVNLQKLRLANTQGIKLNINGNINTQKIPPLLLISFIENAFKYGADNQGNTNVTIDISVNNNNFLFTCSNSVNVQRKQKESSGIGIQNTKKRLNLLFPNSHELVIVNETSEFSVHLSLKLAK